MLPKRPNPKVSLHLGNTLLILTIILSLAGLLASLDYSVEFTSFTVANESVNITITTSPVNVSVDNTTVVAEPIVNESVVKNETTTNTSVIIETNVTNEISEISFEEFLEQYDAVVGQPVKWKKKIKSNGTAEGVKVTLPAEAVNIEVKKIVDGEEEEVPQSKLKYARESKPLEAPTLLSGAAVSNSGKNILYYLKVFASFFKPTITGAFSVEGTAEDGNITIAIEESTEEIEVEYETPAPEAFEDEIIDGMKRVVIGSEFNYTDVLAFTSVPEGEVQNVDLYHIVDGLRISTEIVKFLDLDYNGVKDTVFWVVPHLSNQTYELDLVILNPSVFVPVGDDWVVYFNTTGTAKLNITKDEEAVRVLSFNNIFCGEQEITPIIDGPSVIVSNWSCDGQTARINHTKINDSPLFTQKFVFGEGLGAIVEFAEDPMFCDPWSPGPPPDCSACVPEGFVGFDIAPPVDGVCYSDPNCKTTCGGGGNNDPVWDENITYRQWNNSAGSKTADSNLSSSGNGLCSDADSGDTLNYIIASENTSQVDCTITGVDVLDFNPAQGYVGNATCRVTCDDGNGGATTTPIVFTIYACEGSYNGTNERNDGAGAWKFSGGSSTRTCNSTGTNFETIMVPSGKTLIFKNASDIDIKNITVNSSAVLNMSFTNASVSNFINVTGNITLYNTSLNLTQLNITNRSQIYNSTMNMSSGIIVKGGAIVNITNSRIYSTNTNVTGTGSRLHVDPSTWIDEGIIDVGLGGILQYVDTGVRVKDFVFVHGGVLDFLTNSVLSMNGDSAGSAYVKVVDEAGENGIMTIDDSSVMNRNGSFNYDVYVLSSGELSIAGTTAVGAKGIRNLTVDSTGTLTLVTSPEIWIEKNATIDGTLTQASSLFNFVGNGTVKNAGRFYNVNMSTDNIINQSSNINISNDFKLGNNSIWNTTTSNYKFNVTNLANIVGKLDGSASSIFFGSLTIKVDGTYRATSGTTNLTTGNLSNTGTFTHNSGKVSFNRASGNRNQTINSSNPFFNLDVAGSTVLNQTSNISVNNNFNVMTGAMYLIDNRGNLTIKGTTTLVANSNISVVNGTIFNATMNGNKTLWLNGTNYSLNAMAVTPIDSGSFKNVSSYVNISGMGPTHKVQINQSYSESLLGDVAEDTLTIFRHTGSAWSNVTTSVRDAVANYISASATTFSVFGVGGGEKSISLGLSGRLSNQINWSVTSLAITDDHNATGNNNAGSTNYSVSITADNTLVDVYIKSNGSLVKNGGGSIAQDKQKIYVNETEVSVPLAGSKSSLTSAYTGNLIANANATGANIYIKFFLNVPGATGAGNYKNKVTIKGVEDGNSP